MLSIAFLIGLIVGVTKLSAQARKDEQIALQKGVSEDLWMMLTYSIWLFIIPPVMALILPWVYTFVGAVVLACFYLPSIIASKKISPKLGRGFDYERKAGRNIDRIAWLGYAGIGLVVFHWAMFSGLQMLKAGME
jgi:hypothetical protein